jgi:Plasmid pRiA4b ORF-3-like protein
VWRRLLVASDTTFAELHEILQSAFDWSGEHLHRFLIDGAAYGIRCLGGIVFQEDARWVPLFRYALVEAELRRRKTALEPGIIWSASIVTSIGCPSKNSELWLRRCIAFLIPMAIVTPLAISTNCAKLSIG